MVFLVIHAVEPVACSLLSQPSFKCVTMIANITTESYITFSDHNALAHDFSLTNDDEFHDISHHLEIHGVGDTSLTALLSPLFPFHLPAWVRPPCGC